MFIASKYEDIYPLKMKDVYEKISHKRLPHSKIKEIELELLVVTNYNIQAPTVLEFLKVYLKDILGINSTSKQAYSAIEKSHPKVAKMDAASKEHAI